MIGGGPQADAGFSAALAAAWEATGRGPAEGQGTAPDPDAVSLPVVFCRDWRELKAAPALGRLIPDLDPLVSTLMASGANQWRIFHFHPGGAIRACIVLVRIDAGLASVPFAPLALGQAVQSLLLWSDHAFTAGPPAMATEGGGAAIPLFVARLLRAAYGAEVPDASADPALAEILAQAMAEL